ncbi:peptidase inhibitor family I36 protein [Streptomyces sp. URMC 126]|uniref:peptidase inhibitor family I36 protein n=1 Tax=Streptomyces sp. URMC 126 TaxID=3423401 RepID=UPI003F1A3801
MKTGVKRITVLAVAALTATVPFASPAQAADGVFRYQRYSTGFIAGPHWTEVRNPTDYVCYNMTAQEANSVQNNTNHTARVYKTSNCTGWNTTIVTSGKSASSVPGFKSFKVLDT